MDEMRRTRVAGIMREELSELIRYESDDPRLAEVDVTNVILAPDMRRAEILVSLPAGPAERRNALEGLDHARHYLRRQLMQRLDIFRMPELRFRPDSETSSDSGNAPLGRLARRLRRGRPRDDNTADS